MVKRTLSLLLVLVMVLGIVPISQVQAAQSDDIVYVDESTSMSELVDKGIVTTDQPVTEPAQLQTPVIGQEPEEEPEVKPQAPEVTVCDCGMEGADIYNHTDDCALRLYLLKVCDNGTAVQVYELWQGVDLVTRGFLEGHLAANAPEKLAEVLKLIDADAIPDDSQTDPGVPNRLPGEASAAADGITVDALGVPEGSSLTVQEPSKATQDIVEEIMAAAEDEPEQVFLYDISVQNDQSSDWQPEGTSVQMTLTLEGVDLPQYTEVRIIHVDDEGNDSLITGYVGDHNNIVFETEGFSTFAGFTVDFTYGSVMVSIPGKTSTTMGHLFKEMKMPLNAADIVDVQFSDYSLLTVTKEENDWRLTSLVAFNTNETLTFTMKDGTVYEFMVTDAQSYPQYPDVETGAGTGWEDDDNGHARWFADDDGELVTTGTISDNYRSYYWSQTAIVYVYGTGDFEFSIQPNGTLDKSATTCYVNMKGMRIMGGANVSFYVGGHFESPSSDTYSNTTPWSKMKNVIIRGTTTTENLFWLMDGSLTLKGTDKIMLCMRSTLKDTDAANTNPVVYLGANGGKHPDTDKVQADGATRFVARNVNFYQAKGGAVFSRGTQLEYVEIKDCWIESNCNRSTGTWNGGAIYFNTGNAAQGYVCKTKKIVIENVRFADGDHRNSDFVADIDAVNRKGPSAGSYGGAIFLGGYINETYIKNCNFVGTSAGASGGAITLRGSFGKVEIEGCLFKDCTAKKDGGAIAVETLATDDITVDGKETATKFSRMHTLNLKNCKFINCQATAEHSEENDGVGGAVTLAMELQNVNIEGCVFDGNKAKGGDTNLAGGGLSFGYVNLGDTGNDPNGDMRLPWTDALTWVENGVTMGTDARSAHQGWWMDGETEKCYRQRITFGTVNITDTVFKNASDTYQGGGFIVRTGTSIEDLNVTDTTFENNQVEDKGSAVFFNNCIIATVDFLRCTFQGNKVTESIHTGGGTVRTVGQTSSKMTFDQCKFLDNVANQAGGGIYWNAGQTRKTPEGRGGETMAVVKNCEFRRNTAVRDPNVKDLQEDGTPYPDGVYPTRYGGGIFCETVMTVEKCIFDGNKSEIGGGLCMGVYNATYRMFGDDETTQLALDANTEFFNNQANCGGGLAIRANKTLAIADTDTTLKHTVKLTLNGTKIYNNVATENGGGIYFIAEQYEGDELGNAEVERYTKMLDIQNGAVYSNTAGKNGGGIYMESRKNTTINMANGTIYDNKSGWNREMTFTKDSSGKITGTSISEGSATGGNGGGIYLTGPDSTVNISGGIIGAYLDGTTQVESPNKAYKLSSNANTGIGGGVAITGGADIVMTGGNIVYNQSDRTGAGIALLDTNNADLASSLRLDEGIVSYNRASNNGGGIFTGKNNTFTMNGGQVNNNYSATWGAGIYVGGLNSKGYLNGGKIHHNTTPMNGGGLCAQNRAYIHVNGCTIFENAATGSGGGIFATYSAVDVDAGSIYENNADMGGAVYVTADSTLNVIGGEIYENTANNGGGIYVCNNGSSKSYMTVQDGKIYSNKATTYGGGILLSGGDATISGGEIYDNESILGGGIFLSNVTADNLTSILEISNGKIYGNRAVLNANNQYGNGGGLYSLLSEVTLKGGELSDNYAQAAGGAIYSNAGTVNIENGVLKNNWSSDVFDKTVVGKVGDGGAMYILQGVVNLTGGEMTGNKAALHGGAAYMNRAEVNISQGSMSDNAATYGGAMFLFLSTTTIDGGTVSENRAHQGGGIFVRAGTTNLNGGDIKDNKVETFADLMTENNKHGGGITIDGHNSKEEGTLLTITGGNITGNSAPQGGGIRIKNVNANLDHNVTCVINGGTISRNTTTGNGGGIYIDSDNQIQRDAAGKVTNATTLTMNGGLISENSASGNGGGIYATAQAQVSVVAKDAMHGEIDKNTASNGGGVYVTAGADLEVRDGYITNNSAVAPSDFYLSTARGNDDALAGTGGGICVTKGTDDANSTFTLSGTNMAIYGNTATFAADDVFSSGIKTQLSIPKVKDMNLAGYGFKPEGWFEDYNTGDDEYQAGLNMITKNGGWLDLQNDYTIANVYRYRNANSEQRRYMHIKPSGTNGENYVEGAAGASYQYVNKHNAYVAMTLGIPAATDDTVVYDFVGPVDINLWQNDLFMNPEDFGPATKAETGGYLSSTFPADAQFKDGVYYTPANGGMMPNVSGTWYYNTFRKYYGEVTNQGSGVVRYSPRTMDVKGEDVFYYAVKHNDYWYYAGITVVPATSIYFEDTATYTNENDTYYTFVKYHTNDDSGVVNGELVDVLADWEQTATETIGNQGQDRPGTTVLEGLDADNIYGYDESYASYSNYSGGSAHKVTVSRHEGKDEDGNGLCDDCGLKVQFEHQFTGKANGKCNICLNTADKHTYPNAADHTCSDTHNYNEYCDICSKWIGTHTKNARATFTFTGTGFDIISLCNANTGLVTVSVYDADSYKKIQFCDDPNTDAWEPTDPLVTYMVDTYYETGDDLYQVPVIKVDMNEAPAYDENWNVVGYCGYGTYTVEIYVAPSFIAKDEHAFNEADFYLDAIRIYNPLGSAGEEGEVAHDAYIADGEAWPVYQELRNMLMNQSDVSDILTSGAVFIDTAGTETNDGIPTLDEYIGYGPNNEIYLNKNKAVAFKLDNVSYAELVQAAHIGLRGLTGTGSVTISDGNETVQISNLSATDMYYDISKMIGKVVTITNTGDKPVAISNLKVTHKAAPAVTSDISYFVMVNDEVVNTALEILTPEQLVDPVVKPKYPALSFEGMVCYNVFFTAEDLGDLTAADLGLAVFNSQVTDGTVENADEVHLGAQEIDGLYMVATNGVHAKYLGDTKYFRAFVKKADGSYIYSKMVSYSALDYAKNVLAKSEDVALKQLVVAMLNYGAEAQTYFGYKTDDLMNKGLTAEHQALLNGFDASSLNAVGKVDASKIGAFASNGGFAKRYPAISFKGAFEINYFFKAANAVDGDMKLYFWNEDTYNAVTELSADNADKVVAMTLEDGLYTAASDEIIAKNLDKTVYVAAVYESDGETYCSGVLAYSIAAYCQNPPADVQALATAAAIYGCTAKQFFGA